MAATEQQVVGLELEKVVSRIRTAFDRDDLFFATIEKRDVEKISNRQMRVPIELRPGGNFGYFNANGGDLGRGGAPTYDKAVLQAVFMKEGIEYTKLTQWSTDDNRKAIVSAVRKFTATALDEIRRQIDSQMMQNGTGQIGTIDSVSTSGDTDTYVLTNEFGARLVRYGQVVQVFSSAYVFRGKGTITFLDLDNNTIQVSPAIAGAAADDVLITDGIDQPTALPALYGVPYHHSNASTGVWLGFNRATTPEVRSNRVNGNNQALTLPLPRLAINKIGNRVGINNGFNPVAWMHPCQKQAYEEIGQLVSMIFKKPQEEALNMYFDAMQMAGAPVKVSFNWNKTRIDFVVGDLWGRGEILPLGFYTTDGRKTFEIRGASGGVATADIFYMTVGMQTFVANPAGTAYIDALAIPAGY